MSQMSENPDGEVSIEASIREPNPPFQVGPADLPWTGERLVPSLSGDIVFEHLHRYAIAAELAHGREVLDIACGEGYGSHLLAHGARSVIGVDIAPDAIRHAAAKYARHNLSFLEGSCTAIPLPDASVDLVVTFETIEHLDEHDAFMAEIRRVLREDGLLIVSTPERENYDATLTAPNPYHRRELAQSEFSELLGANFKYVHLLGQRVIHGSVVAGQSAHQPQTHGMFRGDFGSTEFSESLAHPTFLVAVCRNVPLPAIPVGGFEYTGEISSNAVVQVFADSGTGYEEARSFTQPLTPGAWQTIRFEHLDGFYTVPGSRLRIDPVNRPALVELAAIRILGDSGNAVHFGASAETEWARLDCSAGSLLYSDGKSLILLATDHDPQIFLPPLPEFQHTAFTLELTLRYKTTIGELALRLHDLATGDRSLAALAAAEHLRVRDQLGQTQQEFAQMRSDLERQLHERSLEAGQLRNQLRFVDGQLVQTRSEFEHRLVESAVEAAQLRDQLSSASKRLALTRADLKRRLAIRSAEVVALKKAAASAAEWQRKWYKRVFHHWRPPGHQAHRAGLLRKLERSIRKRRKALALFVTTPFERRRFFDRQLRSLEKRKVAMREDSIRLAARLGLTDRLRRLDREARMLRKAGLVKAKWYCAQHPEALLRERDAVMHYVRIGAALGWNPNPAFDTRSYLEENPDLIVGQENPLIHYLRNRKTKGRSPGRGAASEAKLHDGNTGRKDDWDRFHNGYDEIGWRLRLRGVPIANLPTISVVMPVYQTPISLLERAVGSVRNQEYPNWELCIADDGSGDQALRDWLETWARTDPRIKVVINRSNCGISSATNDAFALCTGDFVALLDHDDELTADALGEVAATLAEHPETDVVYSDQDKMDSKGRRFEPFHKPAWSPVFFLGVMYVGHLLVIRRSILVQVDGCDPRFDKVQDYELMLRVSEVTDRIRHIPKILYHWRAVPGSVATSPESKTGMEALQIAAVAAHFKRLDIRANPCTNLRHAHRVLLEPGVGQEQPLVSIIIPSLADSPLLINCLTSIVEKTTYPDYEVLLIVRKDSIQTEPQVSNLAAARNIQKVRVIEYDFPFNYSRVNNHAVSQARGQLIVLLNDDTQVVTPKWLEIMVTHLAMPGVGVVGPRLLFPDGSVQHAGVVLGFRGTADHVMRGFPGDCDGYFGSLSASREVSAVTGACLMTRVKTFQSLGGMKECFSSIYQDVDFCLRIREMGLSSVYVANVELMHHESQTRGSGYNHLDREILIDRWRDRLTDDPCYNRNFTRNRHDYTLRSSQS